MADDIREALARAADQAPLPGPRVGAWVAAVPGYAARAREPEARPRVDTVRALLPAPLPVRRDRVARGTLAAAVVAVFSLSVAVMAAVQAGPSSASRNRPVTIATASASRGGRAAAEAVAGGAVYDGCPPGESRVVSLQSGYTFCRPSAWQVRDYGFTSGNLGDFESVTGLVNSVAQPTPDRRTPELPAADVLVTVSFDTLASAAASGHLTSGKALSVSGLPAMDFVLSDTDPLAAERVVLVQRGDRVYRIEQVRDTPGVRLAFQEVLRTFVMQGLPYSADEQLRIAQSKTG